MSVKIEALLLGGGGGGVGMWGVGGGGREAKVGWRGGGRRWRGQKKKGLFKKGRAGK